MYLRVCAGIRIRLRSELQRTYSTHPLPTQCHIQSRLLLTFTPVPNHIHILTGRLCMINITFFKILYLIPLQSAFMTAGALTLLNLLLNGRQSQRGHLFIFLLKSRTFFSQKYVLN